MGPPAKMSDQPLTFINSNTLNSFYKYTVKPYITACCVVLFESFVFRRTIQNVNSELF